MPTHLHLYNQSTECRETVLPPAELKKHFDVKKNLYCAEKFAYTHIKVCFDKIFHCKYSA